MRRTILTTSIVLAGYLVRRLRQDAYTNLQIAFGPSGTQLYFRFLMSLADNITGVLASCRKNPARRPTVRFEDALAGTTQMAPPWIFVTGHVGAFELMGAWTRHLKFPEMSVVVRPPKRWLFRKLLNVIRRRLGTRVIAKRNALKECMRTIEEGRSVAIIADHNAGFNGVFIPFLGFPASTTRLPAVLAMKYNKPVVIGFIRKEANEYVTWIERVITPNPEAEPAAEELRILTEMNSAFTDVIRRYPHEWFWFHRRWKTRPGDKEARILR